MNRREFMKWAGRLLTAFPFIALADLGAEPEAVEVHGISPLADTLDLWLKSQALSLGESQEDMMKFWHDKDAIIRKVESIPWDLEAPREEVERLSKILSEIDNVNGYFYRNILQPDTEIVEYNL